MSQYFKIILNCALENKLNVFRKIPNTEEVEVVVLVSIFKLDFSVAEELLLSFFLTIFFFFILIFTFSGSTIGSFALCTEIWKNTY